MIQTMLASNGFYLIVFILCIIGGYTASKMRKRKQLKLLEKKQPGVSQEELKQLFNELTLNKAQESEDEKQ